MRGKNLEQLLQDIFFVVINGNVVYDNGLGEGMRYVESEQEWKESLKSRSRREQHAWEHYQERQYIHNNL